MTRGLIAGLFGLAAGCASQAVGLDLPTHAVAFRAVDLDGRPTSLGAFRGHPILITVINTWADPALYEVPRLRKVYRDYGPKGLAVLCIALDETSETVRIFRETFEIPYPVLMVEDRATFTSDQGPLGPIEIVPTSYLIDSSGVIAGRVQGTWPEGLLERAVEELLAADPSTK